MIQITLENTVTVIELGPSYESLDATALEDFGSVLLTKASTVEPPYLVLDLSHTRYIGSAFLELVVRAWKRLSERGGMLALCKLQPFCAEVLQIARLDRLWRHFPDRAQAVEWLTSHPDAPV